MRSSSVNSSGAGFKRAVEGENGGAPVGRRLSALRSLLILTTTLWGQHAGQQSLAEGPGLIRGPMLVRSWRVEDGLPLSQIQSLAQSADGYLWMAAPHEGLYRFDGLRFSAPQCDPHSPQPLEGKKEVSALLASRDGSLWVGFSRGGLWRLKDGRWDRVTPGSRFPVETIGVLYEDANGDVWVGSSTGVTRLSGASVRAYLTADGLSGKPVSAIYRDRQANLWVGTEAGELHRLQGERFARIPAPIDQGGDAIRTILQGRDGSLWVGSWDRGVGRLVGGSFRSYGERAGLAPGQVFALAEDRWGAIWIGTQRGLFALVDGPDPGRVRIRHVGRVPVMSLLRDCEGTIWAGTIAGLEQYKDWKLRVYSELQGLPERNICAVLPTQGGDLLIGMTTAGIARFRDGRVVATYGVAQGLSSDDVTSICESRDGTIWVGTWGEGVNRSQGGKFQSVAAGAEAGAGIIRSIYEDRHGDLWIGTWGQGLRRRHDGRFSTYTARDGLADDRVRVVEEDAAGNVWIATHNGLSRFSAGRFRTFTTRDGLSEDSVFALRADRDGSLWIGTWGGGLVRLRGERFTAYTTREGLPCDTICEILLDDDNNLWLGTTKGIVRVRKFDLDAFDRGSITSIESASFGTAEGMYSAQCNRGTQPSGCRTADGRLWFATIDGVVMIDPRSVPTNEQAPCAIVERVSEGRNPVRFSASIRLPAGPRELTFHYTATSLAAPEKVRFRYKLEGYNVDWYEAGPSREAHYTNIPPGSYAFLVKACSGDGAWGPASAALHLDITPPFYQTAWFLSAAGASLIASVLLAHRLRVARLRAREQALVVLVERRTTEARAAQQTAEQASRAKDRFLAVLSHELRTPLTPVLLSVGCLRDEEISPHRREQLDMIRRNIELEARLVDDLLDVSRIERGDLRLELEEVDVHEAIDHALETCAPEVQEAGLNVVRDLRAAAHHARADYARLVQVFWNLIRNAAKFAAPLGTLTIRSGNEPAQDPAPGGTRLFVEFHDTGMGIERHLLSRIFEPFEQGSERNGGLGLGLAISRWVAEAPGGTLTARSAGSGQGSSFRLELAVQSTTEPVRRCRPREEIGPEQERSLRILLVEDNADTLRYLGIVLSRLGHEVRAASRLDSAREAAATFELDLLISDIELPDGSGLELMRELAARGIPGIALSGYGSEVDVQQSRAAGFGLHLVKPVLVEALREAIRKVTCSSDPIGPPVR
jgi:ligand-binding sensor domain-containing protein/signal transduction histidine kinase/ActR/RegA family two-component response regulator